MEVNDYVRTKDGIVAKIVDVKENPYGEKTIFELDRKINIFNLEMSDIYFAYNPMAEETTNKIDTHFGDDKIIIKSSPNIIDLIEVGDYVNGYKVDFTNIENKLTYEEKNIGFYDGDGDITLFENDIKSIVTKEIFSSIEYEVKQ